MRIRVRHETRYSYAVAPKSVTQILRMTPRSHEGQHVIEWRIDCDADCRLKAGEDAFGNLTHVLTIYDPPDAISIVADGVVETFDTAGLVSNSAERFASELFMRETALTRADEDIRALAHGVRANTTLDMLHVLMSEIHRLMTFDPDPTHSATPANEAFGLRRGVCQDYSHIFIAAARARGVPARYVSGHFCRSDGAIYQEAGHAWAEAYVDQLGWVGFDATHGICPHENHIRVACGLDYLDAAPVRGARIAGSEERLHVAVAVAQAETQIQN